MAIRQVTTSNTFLQWLVATQGLIDAYNFYENRTNLVFTTANDVSNTANLVFVANNNVTNTAANIQQFVGESRNYANTIFQTANNAWNIANAAYSLSNSAVSNLTVIAAFNKANSGSNTANAAYAHANGAFNLANSINIFSIAAFSKANTLNINDTVNNNTFFVTFVSSNSSVTNVSINNGLQVSSTKLTYNPFTGTLNSVVFNSLSDENRKEDIVTVSGNIVPQLRGVEFVWKDTKQKASGLIAQEVEKVLPHLITINEEGVKSINYDGVIAYLIETVKDLNTRITELENKINTKE